MKFIFSLRYVILGSLLLTLDSISAANHLRQSALFRAVINGNIDAAKKLIESGIDVNLYSDEYKSFALIEAAMYNQYDMVKMLVSKGADVNLTSSKKGNMTALHFRVKIHEADLQIGVSKKVIESSQSIIRYLLEHGANPYLKNSSGQNVFYFAGNDERIVKMLTVYFAPKKSSERSISGNN